MFRTKGPSRRTEAGRPSTSRGLRATWEPLLFGLCFLPNIGQGNRSKGLRHQEREGSQAGIRCLAPPGKHGRRRVLEETEQKARSHLPLSALDCSVSCCSRSLLAEPFPLIEDEEDSPWATRWETSIDKASPCWVRALAREESPEAENGSLDLWGCLECLGRGCCSHGHLGWGSNPEPLKGKLDLSDCRGDFGLITGHATGSLEAVGPGAARAGPKEGPGGPRKEAAQKSKGQRRPENRQRTEAGMGKSTRKGRRRAGHRH